MSEKLRLWGIWYCGSSWNSTIKYVHVLIQGSSLLENLRDPVIISQNNETVHIIDAMRLPVTQQSQTQIQEIDELSEGLTPLGGHLIIPVVSSEKNRSSYS